MEPSFYVVSLNVHNMPLAAHFYRDVIGLPVLLHHGDRPHFDLGGSYLVLLPGKTSEGEGDAKEQFPKVAFRVADLDRYIDRLQAHFVELPWGIESNETSRWVKFYDPASNLIELVEIIQAV